MKNKIAAALLAFFLGGIGVHRFYLGQTGKGILYLVFCWTFIPYIISIVDFVLFLTMSDEDFDYKYNRAYLEDSYHGNTAHNFFDPDHGTIQDRDYVDNSLEQLEKLGRLRDSGILTQAEFERKKEAILR